MSWTVKTLRAEARRRGLRRYSQLRRAELLELLGITEDRRTVRELRRVASHLGIPGRSAMRRADLVAAIAGRSRPVPAVNLDQIIDDCQRPSAAELAAAEREDDVRAYLAALRTASLGRQYADALAIYQRHGVSTPANVVAVLDQATRLAWLRARDVAGDRSTWARRHQEYLRACGQAVGP